jgi:hypothetical protein
MKRRSSWRDTFRGLASGGDTDVESGSSAHKGSTKVSKNISTGDEGVLADAESDDDDFNQRKVEDRPIQARILYNYPAVSEGVPRSHSALVRQQPELSIAVEEANTKAIKAVSRRKSPATESIGTRLTMTSRTGYFQDRIISPSMVCLRAFMINGPWLTNYIDARHGNIIYRASSESRFHDRLPHISYFGTLSFASSISPSSHAMWRERSLR